MNHLSDFDNEELLDMYELQVTENTTGIRTAQELLEDLKSIREEVLRRMTAAAESHCRMGVACPQHDGQVHGQEASELRTALEALLEEVEGTKFTRSDPWEAEEVCYKIQIDVLDKVDCRDSLAFEQKNDRQARREQADKVSLSVEGLDLLLKLRMLEDDNHPTTKSLKKMGLLVSMVNPDGVSLSLLGEQLLEKLKG